MPCGWKGNRRSCVALSMRHMVYPPTGSRKDREMSTPAYAVLWSTAPFTSPVLLMHADLLRLVCCCFIAVAASLVGERAGAQANCSLKYRRRACTMITPAIRHPYDQWRRQDFVTGGGSEVWVHRGSRVRSPPEADTFTAVHSSMTVKAHTLLHNFWTSTHRGGSFPPFPPGGATAYDRRTAR